MPFESMHDIITPDGLGMVYLHQEKYEFTEHHLPRAFQINPHSSVLMCYLGMALHSLKHASISPDCKLLVVVRDHLDGLLVDAQNGKTVSSLVSHLDYSFTSTWHPNGRAFATGNQDKACRVWDIRNLSSPVAVLKCNLGAVRSISFSSDGQFLAVAEPADFVHIYNTKVDYKDNKCAW